MKLLKSQFAVEALLALVFALCVLGALLLFAG